MNLFADGDLHAAFINLDSRPDRLESVTTTLARAGVEGVERFRALTPEECWPLPEVVMATDGLKLHLDMPGQLGCFFSHLRCMEAALAANKHLLVMEDDLVICSDFHERLAFIKAFLRDNPWDIFWLDGYYHAKPAYWHVARHPKMKREDWCRCKLNRDVEKPVHQRIVRTYGHFTTTAYLVNRGSLKRIMRLVMERLPIMVAIDYVHILIQPQIRAYAFLPGLIKQGDGFSDIRRNVNYNDTGFRMLGGYFWQDKMDQFDPQETASWPG